MPGTTPSVLQWLLTDVTDLCSQFNFGIDLGFTSTSWIAVARNVSDTKLVECVGAVDTGQYFEWAPFQILAILRELVSQAEAVTGLEVKQVVVTVPTTCVPALLLAFKENHSRLELQGFP